MDTEPGASDSSNGPGAERVIGRPDAPRPVVRLHGLRIALVLIGIAITIPAFLTGAELGLALGFRRLLIAVGAGAAVLCVIGALAAVVAARTRLTTYMIVEYAFGTRGAVLVNLVIAITIFGWFTVTAAFFGDAVASAARDVWGLQANLHALIVAGSVLVVTTTVFGFAAIDRLAQLTVPPMLGILVWLVYVALDGSTTPLMSTPGFGTVSLGQGITAVIGGFIVGAVIMPDYCRHVRNERHGVLAAILHFGMGYPVILLMLAVVAISAGTKNFVGILAPLGFGMVGVVIIVLATWTTNVGNLYSNALVLQKLVPSGVSQRRLVVALGALGTLLAVLGVAEHLVQFLLLLGTTVPPIAGIYLADYFIVRRGRIADDDLARQPAVSYPAFAAWFLAVAVAYATSGGHFTLTTIPACDAIVVAFVGYLFGSLVMRPGSRPTSSRPSAP